MELREIRQLIKLVEKSDIGELEIVENGNKVRITKNNKLTHDISSYTNAPVNTVIPSALNQIPITPTAIQTTADEQAASESAELNTALYHEVRSPMVGTFYRAAAPDASPYVKEGDEVQPGRVLCIIEAMKLMNEIEAEISGTIIKILAENGKPVEYNQPLFLVKKS